MLKESPKIHFNESGSTCVQAHQPKKNTQDPQAVTVLLNSCSLVTRLFLNFWCSSYWPQIIVAAMRPELWADFWWCDMSGRLWWYPATCFQTSKEDSHLHVFFGKQLLRPSNIVYIKQLLGELPISGLRAWPNNIFQQINKPETIKNNSHKLNTSRWHWLSPLLCSLLSAAFRPAYWSFLSAACYIKAKWVGFETAKKIRSHDLPQLFIKNTLQKVDRPEHNELLWPLTMFLLCIRGKSVQKSDDTGLSLADCRWPNSFPKRFRLLGRIKIMMILMIIHNVIE